MSISKFRILGGIAAVVAALTLFFGVPGKSFIDNSAARCDGTQTALAVGRTQRSLVVICADQNGRYEYRGVRISDGALLKAPAETATDTTGSPTRSRRRPARLRGARKRRPRQLHRRGSKWSDHLTSGRFSASLGVWR